MKEILIGVNLDSQKLRKSVFKSTVKLKGIDSISFNSEKKTLTVVGDVDPVKLVARMRKMVSADLISVHPQTRKYDMDKSFQPASYVRTRARMEAQKGEGSFEHNNLSKGKAPLCLSPEDKAPSTDFDQDNAGEFLEDTALELVQDELELQSPMDETANEFRLSFERRMQSEEELSEEDHERIEIMKQTYNCLLRKKDYLHLVLSYPMMEEPDDYFSYGNDHNLLIFSVNQQLGLIEPYLSHYTSDKYGNESIKAVWKQINEAFQNIQKDLAIYDFNLVAYLPQVAYVNSEESLIHRVELGLMSQSSGIFEAPDEMLKMAIESATRQVLECVEYMGEVYHKIGISGSGGEKVAEALRGEPLIKAMYGGVVYVSVLPPVSITDIEENIARQISELLGSDHISRGSLKSIPQNFLFLMDCVDVHTNLHDLIIPDHGQIVLFTGTQSVYEIMQVDLEIRMEDHLLPWTLFNRNLYPIMKSSSTFLHMGVKLVQMCGGHLLSINLLARALSDAADDLAVWRLALDELASAGSSSKEAISNIMFHVLKIIWDRKDIATKYCIYRCSTVPYVPLRGSESLSIFEGIVQTVENLEDIFEDLVNSFLVENVGDGHIRMRQEVKIVLEKYFIDQLPDLNLRKGGEFGIGEAMDLARCGTKVIYLMDSKIPKILERPNFLFLRKLWLNNNYDLMEIPNPFFQEMPLLQFLDLSCTSITSLPPSISSLISLRTFHLRSCELLMELPAQIGKLENLEVLDLEGTELMYLPREIGNLTSLRCFKLSFCASARHFKEKKHIERTIPFKAFLKLSQLYELSIDATTDDEWWIADLRALLIELGCLKKLRILRLSLPSVEVLELLKWDGTKPMYPDLFQFSFTIGRHRQRIISRVPDKVRVIFQKWEKSKKCLVYVNGEAILVKFMEVLKHATVLFLDRHWTVKVLSDFGNVNLTKLRFCLLVECYELQFVIDGVGGSGHGHDAIWNPVFGHLQYLGIHYMKSLRSIWRGRVGKGSLSNLKCLAIHTCPSLTVFLTLDLLVNLVQLEEIIVEDCPMIGSLVSTQEFSRPKSGYFLQKLKKISLLDLPELISISGGLIIAPVLTSLIVYQCPKLKHICATDVYGCDLKIKGEKEWWDTLEWDESQGGSIHRPDFEELQRGEDLMDQLAKEIYVP